MRVHVELDGALVAQVDQIAGPRRRSAFVREAVRDVVDRHRRRVAGIQRDNEHDWDDDPAAWVRRQRFGDPRRVG